MIVGVDPRIAEFAESFVDLLLISLGPRAAWHRRDELVARAAAAMQQAIDDEGTAIRQELSS